MTAASGQASSPGEPRAAFGPHGWNKVPLRATAVLSMIMFGATGCTSALEVKAAADAGNPGCATILSHVPSTLAGLARRDTTGLSTTAWGTPSGVVLRCGVAVPGPTTLVCGTVNGVDWIVQEAEDTRTMTTYGRTPAVEVVMKIDNSHAGAVPAALGPAMALIPAVRRCVGPADVPALRTH